MNGTNRSELSMMYDVWVCSWCAISDLLKATSEAQYMTPQGKQNEIKNKHKNPLEDESKEERKKINN